MNEKIYIYLVQGGTRCLLACPIRENIIVNMLPTSLFEYFR